jgi:hypothetical protein
MNVDELRKILKLDRYYPALQRVKDHIEIDLGTEATVGYAQLFAISEFFGTEKVDVNSYMERGGSCETCAYEHANLKIQIYDATKNVPEFDKHGFAIWKKENAT